MRQMSAQEYQDQQYAPPVAYFEPTPSEIKGLETEANTLRAEIDNKGTSWVNRTRASSRLGEVDRLIKSGKDAAQRAQVVVQQTCQPVPTIGQLQNSQGRYVLCGKGGNAAYLWFKWGDEAVA